MAKPVVLASSVVAGGDITITPPTGTNLILFIYVEGRSSGGLSAPTFDGNAMTLLVRKSATAQQSEIWGYANPATGSSKTIYCGFGIGGRAYDTSIALAIQGANLAIPLGSWATYTKSGDSTATTTDISQAVSSNPADLIVDGEGHFRTTTPTAIGSGQSNIRVGINYGTSSMLGGGSPMIWNLNYGTANLYAWAGVVVPGTAGGAIAMLLGADF